MKKLLWGVLAVALVCVAVICFRQYQERHEFTSNVDLMVEAYQSAVRTKDPADERRHLGMVIACLSRISEAYQETERNQWMTDYLTKHVPKTMFEEIYLALLQYNQDNPDDPIQIDTDILTIFS